MKLSDRFKSIITIFLLISSLVFGLLIGLVGVIMMWFWTKWPKWIKIIISVPYLATFLLVSITYLAILFYIMVGRPFQIKGDAMLPTYRNGQYVMTKLLKHDETLSRGIVVIFNSPKDPTIQFIGRVVGLPNERVMIKDGEVYINGKIIDESPYKNSGVKTYGGVFLRNGEEKTVPPNQFFILHDNRLKGSDSREWGFISRKNIIGKVAFCYWNCSD